MNDDEFLNYGEAAKLLHISPTTLRKKVSLGEVPVRRPFGWRGRVLFSRNELLALIEAGRTDLEPGKDQGQRQVAVRLSPVTLLQLEKTAADKKLTVNELVERGLRMLVESTAGAAG